MIPTIRKEIIIIGAGLAGLAAANRLLEYGFEPLILEARDRCGGRVYIDKSLGIPLGLGANWIHGCDGNPMTDLAKHYHVKLFTTQNLKRIYYNRNQREIATLQVQKFNDTFQKLLKRAEEIAYCLDQDVSLASILSVCFQSEKFSDLEWDLYKNKLYFFENYLGVNFDLLSARYWNQEKIWPGDHCFLINSYENIIIGLQQKCEVVLNTTVKQINLRKQNIEIITNNTIFYADKVILTLPLGVLKNNTVIFNPPLPNAKQEAINRLGMGLLNIAVFKFPVVFWPDDVQILSFSAVDDLSIASFSNLYHVIKEPILLGFYGGKRAQELEKLSDTEILIKSMAKHTRKNKYYTGNAEKLNIAKLMRD